MRTLIFLPLLTHSKYLKPSKSFWEITFACLVVISISAVFLIDAHTDNPAVSTNLIKHHPQPT